jgi:hypothetical protein
MKIGVDIGGVIIAGGADQDNTFFTDDFLQAKGVHLASWAMRRLYAQHDVVLISKAGEETERKTLAWIENRAFFRKIGVLEPDIRFVRKRAQKAPLAKELDVEVFIDDRADICESMHAVGITPVLFLDWRTTLEFLETL